ncbi:endonuclease III [Megalodesulfovibrio gigas]|uniref:Endonuclease III n=1 Tax=Megalodesulfovibrio gigas (strain ATCC 19364 / DSM 1382 / NCIMB 9332 / VKM B-1759) TaxID=1121448 RepID=T2GBC6_MEGG1|nr:endonuclease III [Megalodesulfovibrio gigas]AGW13436.1 putative endonuclease III [Megalodesulfovibrio gigas DSM 1382 = ATCC 19364]
MPDTAASRRIASILATLAARYPAPETMLHWRTPWELLVATVLSAQCTDDRVNKVTPGLFARFPDVAAVAAADVAEVEELIHSTGFFRNKAKHLVATAQLLVRRYAGQVPQSMPALLELPGVARKTANIVLANAFGIQAGVAVDTHVKRLAWRMELTHSKDVLKIERDLMACIPQADWGRANHWLVLFGREVCTARAPRCRACPVASHCPRRDVAEK